MNLVDQHRHRPIFELYLSPNFSCHVVADHPLDWLCPLVRPSAASSSASPQRILKLQRMQAQLARFAVARILGHGLILLRALLPAPMGFHMTVQLRQVRSAYNTHLTFSRFEIHWAERSMLTADASLRL
jgi:hypothetical protein